MAPRIPNPLGAPAELVNALRHLPRIADNTTSMSRDTELLAKIQRDMAEVARRMEGVTTMDARMANIESTMPVLVDVQKDLAQVPEIIAKLDDRIEKLGRIAGRLPGGSKPAKHELDAEPDRDPRL